MTTTSEEVAELTVHERVLSDTSQMESIFRPLLPTVEAGMAKFTWNDIYPTCPAYVPKVMAGRVNVKAALCLPEELGL